MSQPQPPKPQPVQNSRLALDKEAVTIKLEKNLPGDDSPKKNSDNGSVLVDEKVSIDNNVPCEPVSVLHGKMESSRLASGDSTVKYSLADSHTDNQAQVKLETNLSDIQTEVEKLNISGEKTSKESKVVVKKESESLRNLMAYVSSDSEEEADTTDAPTQTSTVPRTAPPNPTQESLDGSSSDSESDSSGSTLFSESDSDNVIEGSDEECTPGAITADNDPRTVSQASDKGAVRKECSKTGYDEEIIDTLPDLSQLVIDSATEFLHIGKISAIISECVTVLAFPKTPAFDLDSMLFICDETSDEKKPLGPIYDVLGPVSEPIYCVRFNSESDVKLAGIKTGMQVYAAPKSEEFTKYVFVRELLKMKGTDASWLNDQEQPIDLAEFSDDEMEREVKRANKTSGKRKLEHDSLERHQRYERTMNQCNTLNTRLARLMDSHRRASRQIQHHRSTIHADPLTPSSLLLPSFNPAVPPPGFFPASSLVLTNTVEDLASFYPDVAAHYDPADVRWRRGTGLPLRRTLFNDRGSHRSSLNHHFANNGRNYRGAGPSSQPF